MIFNKENYKKAYKSITNENISFELICTNIINKFRKGQKEKSFDYIFYKYPGLGLKLMYIYNFKKWGNIYIF